MAQRYDLDRVHLRGASAGGLAVTLAACGVSALDAAEALPASSSSSASAVPPPFLLNGDGVLGPKALWSPLLLP